MGSNTYFLDRYYVLAHKTPPVIAVRTLKGVQVPTNRISVVISTDDPNQVDLARWCKANDLPRPLRFNRETYLHDPYLSLVDEETVRSQFPKTDTPVRRFISNYEYRQGPDSIYAVMDDDVTFRKINHFRDVEGDFDHSVWLRAREALKIPQVWSCHFITPYTWGPSFSDGMATRLADFSKWSRKGQAANQSFWILSSRENHQWFSPIVCDYITTARYAAMGRFSFCLNEYISVGPPNVSGVIWSNDDPQSRSNKAGQLAALRLLGCSFNRTGNKPYRKKIRYMYPHIIEKD